MTIVTLRSCNNYNKKEIRNVLEKVTKDLGGLEKIVRPGDKVLLKPNLLAAKTPDMSVTTHPAVVEAIAEMVLDCKGKPLISDSPGLDPFSLVKRKTGMEEIGKRLNIEVKALKNSTEIASSLERHFKKIELSKDVLEADKIINLPKLKTHCQMTLTMGVKNLFGTVVAQRKAEWHYKVGLNRDLFALLLLEIWTIVKPDMTILDGIWGMEGHGPSNGKPVRLNLLAASDNALAMDLTLSRMLHVNSKEYPLYRAAKRKKLIPERILYKGNIDRKSRYVIDIPRQDSLSLLPSFLDNMGRSSLTSRPLQRIDRCIACRKCINICPADAIDMDKDRKLHFDYNRCIRCYCCHEMCPVNAIELKKGLILKILDLINK